MTENPWEGLALYESRDISARLYQARNGLTLSDSKAREIVSSVAQSHAYFQAAANAATVVAPLLQYYGVLSLTRALNLFLLPESREASLAPSHGLSATSWATVLADGISAIESLPVRVCQGSLRDLLRATINREIYQVTVAPRPNRLIVQRWGLDEDPTNETFTLRDVLARLPDLVPQYEAVFSNPAFCYRAEVFIFSGRAAHADITLRAGDAGLPETSGLAEALGLDPATQWRVTVPQPNTTERATMSCRILADDLRQLLNKLPPIKCNAASEEFVVRPLYRRYSFSTLALLYCLSYILGMLVRYHPTSWLALLARQKGDYLMPLLDAARALIQRRFPQLALEQLNTPPMPDMPRPKL